MQHSKDIHTSRTAAAVIGVIGAVMTVGAILFALYNFLN